MTGNTLLRRLDAEESGVRTRLDRLRSEVTGLEERLAHLAITRRTVAKLLSDDKASAKHHVAPQEEATRHDSEGLPGPAGTGSREDATRLRAVSRDERLAAEPLQAVWAHADWVR